MKVILKVPRLHDGLVTISSVRKRIGDISTDDRSAPVPMKIDVMQGRDQRCYRCHRSRHQRADCIAKKMNDGKEIIDKSMGRRSTTPNGRETDLKKKKRCFNCNKSGHLAKECQCPRKVNQNNALEKKDSTDIWEEVNFLA